MPRVRFAAVPEPDPHPDPGTDPGTDRDLGEAQEIWALQVVLRVERDPRPTATAACEAAASAVAALLAAGEWGALVERWRPAPRKVVRRARGIAWERCLLLDGVTVERGGASARAFPPCPVGALPPELAKLQVGGTDLEDPDRRTDLTDLTDLGAGWPGVLVAVTPAVTMTTGKTAAQCGHATQLALEEMPATRAAAWAASGFEVHVRFPDAAGWAALQAVAPVEVCDAGHTEIPPGTPTVLAAWQWCTGGSCSSPSSPSLRAATPGRRPRPPQRRCSWRRR